MSTKTCPKCGWVCDIADPNNKCPVCKTDFKEGICIKCHKPVTFMAPGRHICYECYNKHWRSKEAHKRMYARRDALYAEWKAKIAKVPTDYPTLTEQQWLEAVKHFNGCAICDSDSVDTRGYFVPFNEGGRYCDWNILPMCDKCATAIRLKPNYFKLQRPKDLIKIVDYLEERLNAALNRSTTENK